MCRYSLIFWGIYKIRPFSFAVSLQLFQLISACVVICPYNPAAQADLWLSWHTVFWFHVLQWEWLNVKVKISNILYSILIYAEVCSFKRQAWFEIICIAYLLHLWRIVHLCENYTLFPWRVLVLKLGKQ